MTAIEIIKRNQKALRVSLNSLHELNNLLEQGYYVESVTAQHTGGNYPVTSNGEFLVILTKPI